MNILLIYPSLGIKRSWLYTLFYFRSLALEQVFACTPVEHNVEIINEDEKPVNFEENYDLIGISCLTCNALRGYEISDEFRKRGRTVVLGGYHPTALPDEAKQHADSVVIGEAELTWPQLINDLKNNKLKPFYIAKEFVDPKLIPPANRSQSSKTLSYTSLQATRGCPVGCDFCSMHKIEGTRFRARPIENVIDEILNIRNNKLLFADASLTINPKYTKSLFRKLKNLGKKVECYGNINILAKDDEFLKLAAEAGCTRWFVGIESISQENINFIGKTTNKIEEYSTAIKKIKDYGMLITGFFMFGFDSDHSDVFDRTQAMYDWNLDSATFSILTPYPGTIVHKKLKEEGRITSYDWSLYTEGNVNFKPKNISVEELKNGAKNAAKQYFSYPFSLRRCINSSNLDFNHLMYKFSINLFASREFNKELFKN